MEALLFGAGGAAKSALIDAPKADRERKLKATQTQLSGWTKRAPSQEVHEADPFGSALTYGVQGASFGQGLQRSAAETDLMKKMANNGGQGSTNITLTPGASDAQAYFNQDYNPWARTKNFGGGL